MGTAGDTAWVLLRCCLGTAGVCLQFTKQKCVSHNAPRHRQRKAKPMQTCWVRPELWQSWLLLLLHLLLLLLLPRPGWAPDNAKIRAAMVWSGTTTQMAPCSQPVAAWHVACRDPCPKWSENCSSLGNHCECGSEPCLQQQTTGRCRPAVRTAHRRSGCCGPARPSASPDVRAKPPRGRASSSRMHKPTRSKPTGLRLALCRHQTQSCGCH